MKLSIIIPVYNDRDFIQKTITQIREVQFPIPYEIVAVDDASTDGSREILGKIPGVRKIFHAQNTGKGGAVVSGLTASTGDIIVIQDDDCEYSPAAIPALIAPIISGQSQVVYGSRFLQKNSMYFIQYLENKAITTLANILLGQQLTDIETGHKAFTRAVANRLALQKKGFEFDMEITLQIIKSGIPIKELPTIYQARTHAQGKKITYKDGWHSVMILLRAWRQIMAGKIHDSQFKKKTLITILFLMAVFLPRLVSLGKVLTVDEPLWVSRGQTFISALSVGNFGKTLVAGQPGITTAWLSGMATPWQSLGTAQAAIAVASGILVLIATYFFRQLIGPRWGLITGFFLALDPFLIAHSRVVHTDALLALFYLNSILALLTGIAHIKQGGKIPPRYIFISSCLGAAAVLTKLYGLVLIPTVVLFIILAYVRKSGGLQSIIRDTACWVSLFILCGFIAWPALWTNADRVYDLLFSRVALHAEGTRAEETTSSIWYYARETAFRFSLPASLLLPFAIWQLPRFKKDSHARLGLALLTTGLIYTLALNSSSDKSDRYILIAHLALICTSVLGLRYIVEKIAGDTKKLALTSWTILAIPIMYLAVDVIRLHPYYLAHYNRLYPIEQTHKLGWGEGLEQAATYIAAKNPQAKVLTYYERVFQHFYQGATEDISHVYDANGDYAVLYRSMFERGQHAPETEIINDFFNSQRHTPEKIITINGLPYVWIFPLQPSIKK
ncbi:MAG: glycosyltransferase [Candidatus Andersenbacteria bacterium]|nr:glycosyltransferase [Candidatus Andersenbacteria bacterium]